MSAAPADSTAAEVIRDGLRPVIAVLTSFDVDQLCAKNNLTFCDLLLPFSSLTSEGITYLMLILSRLVLILSFSRAQRSNESSGHSHCAQSEHRFSRFAQGWLPSRVHRHAPCSFRGDSSDARRVGIFVNHRFTRYVLEQRFISTDYFYFIRFIFDDYLPLNAPQKTPSK